MSPYLRQNSSGAPTFTAASASLSLSGLDHDFSPLVDPNILETAPDWFSGPGDPQNYHQQLSPQHEHGSFSFGSPFGSGAGAAAGRGGGGGGGGGQSSHRAGASHDALHRPQYPALTTPMNGMNGVSHHYDHGVHAPPRIDDLGTISPLQSSYPPYATPYPDSTASSAPSEEPIVADVDEDKRKRNQAASARFRQKKKQREQQMVEQSRDMQERTKKLENEVEGLKRENTFLKKLLVEKVDNMNDDDRALLAKTTGIEKKKK